MFAECGESQSAESLLSAVTAMRELPHDPNDPRFSGLLKVFMRIRGTQGNERADALHAFVRQLRQLRHEPKT